MSEIIYPIPFKYLWFQFCQCFFNQWMSPKRSWIVINLQKNLFSRWEARLAKPHSIQSRFIDTRCFKPPRCGTTCIILFILCITDANDAVSIYECVEYVARCLIPKHYSWILKYGYYYKLLSGHSSLHHRTLPLEVWKFLIDFELTRIENVLKIYRCSSLS